MRKNENSVVLQGRVFSHSLIERKVVNTNSSNCGTKYISGAVNIAIDEEGLNVIPVKYVFVTPLTKSGKTNYSYKILERIMTGEENWAMSGKEGALKVKVDTSLGVEDKFNDDGVLTTTKKCTGGFITIVNNLPEESKRNVFVIDMLISSVKEVDPDNDRNDRHIELKGATFDFRNSILPITLRVESEQGMKFFLDQDITKDEPYYTKLMGKIYYVNKTVEKEGSEEVAFGESCPITYEVKVRKWVVTSAARNPYEFGEENVLTIDDVKRLSQNRQLYLAEQKKRREDYIKQKNEKAVNDAPQFGSSGSDIDKFIY